MKLKSLSKKRIDAIFASSNNQQQALTKLYTAAIPNYCKVKHVGHFPATNKRTSEYIIQKFIDFDIAHHTGIIPGGMWLNYGFSGLAEIDDFMVAIELDKIIYSKQNDNGGK